MNTDEARAYIPALRSLADYLDVTFPAPVPLPTVYETADALDAALAAALPGDTLLLSPSLVYAAPLKLTKAITLQSSAIVEGRIAVDFPAPTFLRGIALLGAGITLVGLEVRNSAATYAIVDDIGADNTVNRCRLLGDPVKGQKRGIAANGKNGTYTQNYIAGCFAPQPGAWTDSQAICAWDTPGPIRIIDNYLEGSSEGILIGGADPTDPTTETNIPHDVTILSNTLFKPLAWQVPGINVKCGIELKNCIGFTIEDNDIENVFGGQGQDGFAFVLTVRNQDGRNPTATIRDGTITGNRIRHAPCAITILGVDDVKETKTGFGRVPIGQVRPSVRMRNVTISVNLFEDMNPAKWHPAATSSKMVQLNHAADDITLEKNDFQAPAGGFGSVLYFVGGIDPKWQRMTARGNRWPKTSYGVFGAGASVNKAWPLYTDAASVLADNVEQ